MAAGRDTIGPGDGAASIIVGLDLERVSSKGVTEDVRKVVPDEGVVEAVGKDSLWDIRQVETIIDSSQLDRDTASGGIAV